MAAMQILPDNLQVLRLEPTPSQPCAVQQSTSCYLPVDRVVLACSKWQVFSQPRDTAVLLLLPYGGTGTEFTHLFHSAMKKMPAEHVTALKLASEN